MAPDFTMAANSVFKATQDPATSVPKGFFAGSMDFASSLIGWVIYKLTCYVKVVGPAILVVLVIVMMLYNRHQILKDEKVAAAAIDAEEKAGGNPSAPIE
jgi:PTS system galactitol-specific IIC component